MSTLPIVTGWPSLRVSTSAASWAMRVCTLGTRSASGMQISMTADERLLMGDKQQEIRMAELDQRAASEQRVIAERELDRKHGVSLGLQRAKNNVMGRSTGPRNRAGISGDYDEMFAAEMAGESDPGMAMELHRSQELRRDAGLRAFDSDQAMGRARSMTSARGLQQSSIGATEGMGVAAAQLGRNPQLAARRQLASQQRERRDSMFALNPMRMLLPGMEASESAMLDQGFADDDYMTGLGIGGELETSGILAGSAGTPSSRRSGARATAMANSAFQRAESFRMRGGPNAEKYARMSLQIGRNDIAASRAEYVSNLRAEQVNANTAFLGSGGTSEALAAFGKAAKKLDQPSGIKNPMGGDEPWTTQMAQAVSTAVTKIAGDIKSALLVGP